MEEPPLNTFDPGQFRAFSRAQEANERLCGFFLAGGSPLAGRIPGRAPGITGQGRSRPAMGNPFTGRRPTLVCMGGGGGVDQGEPGDFEDLEDLSEVAYGLFEVLLNRVLREQGRSLFGLVEAGTDFREDLAAIFDRFASDYPPLADSLTARFGSTDALYLMLTGGEGVIPTKTTLMYWIVQDAPDFTKEAKDDEKAGKWLIFLPDNRVDELWRKVRDATAAGELGVSAKVSTVKPNPESRDERKVIYVYTRDWADEADVMRVRGRLREMGVVDRIGYKRNIETFRGEYSEKGKKVTYYSV